MLENHLLYRPVRGNFWRVLLALCLMILLTAVLQPNGSATAAPLGRAWRFVTKLAQTPSAVPQFAANDDLYETEQDSFLPIPVGTGVLANDGPTPPLTATLLFSPTSGTLAWQNNGSFTYQPEVDYNGLITFTYQAQAEATVASGNFTLSQIGDDRHLVSLGDLDGDGDLDIFAPNDYTTGPGVWFNNGDGTFTGGMNLYEQYGQKSQLGDFEGDGDLDAIVVNATLATQTHEIVKYINDGSGNFTRVPFSSPRAYWDVVLGDWDEDGDVDLWAVDANGFNVQHIIYENDGAGNFTERSPMAVAPDGMEHVGTGDLDKDGDLDAAAPSGVIFFNEGGLQGGTLGQFAAGPQQLHDWSEGAGIADLNGDGWLDIFQFSAFKGTSGVVWFNNGAAGFVEGPTLDNIASEAHLVDVDDDGDVDIIGQIVWLNDGTGSQFTAGQSMALSRMNNITSGDVNGDEAVDLVFVTEGVGPDHYVNIMTNQMEVRQLTDEATVRILVGDVPGPVDITLSNTGVRENQMAGTVVDTLGTIDPTSSNHTYTLVEGAGSEHNAEFAIEGNQLVTAAILDYEAGQSPTRRIRVSTNNGEVTLEKSLTIQILNEEPEPVGTPDQCDGGALKLYDSGDGESSAIVSDVVVSNSSPLGCDVTGTLQVRLQNTVISMQPFTGKVNRWNKLSSTTTTLNDFSFDVAGVVVQARQVRLAEYGGQLFVRLGQADVCAPAEWGGDCVDGTPANLRLDSTGLFAGTGGLPMPDFTINQAPGLENEFAQMSPEGQWLSLLKLSGKATGKKNLSEARITKVEGGYEISAALALGLPKVPIEKGCSIWVAITLFKDENGVVTMTLEPLQNPEGLEFREGTLGLDCDKGIPIGSTGLQISGISGTISLRPDIQFVKIEIEITPVALSSLLFKAKVGATLFWQPEWGFDLEGGAKAFKVFDLGGFKASIRETRMSFTAHVNSSFIRGEVEFHAWWPDGQFHFSGSGRVTLGLPEGAFFSKCVDIPFIGEECINIPPFDSQIGSVGVDGGEFTNGQYGFKGYVKFAGKQYGFYLDDDGNFDVGGVSEYTIATPPLITQARTEWAQMHELVETGQQVWDNPFSFPADDTLVLNVHINPSDVISQVTIVNPSETMFAVSAVDPLSVTLRTPGGDIITPDNAATYSTTYTTTATITYTQYMYDVEMAEIGDWQVIMVGDTTTNPPLLAVIGFANIPTLEEATLGDTSDPGQVEVNWSLSSDTPVTVTIYANAGSITSTVTVTDTNGITTTEVISNFNGIPLAVVPVSHINQLQKAQTLGLVDLTTVESGSYALWLSVNNNLHPDINQYVTLPGSNEVARVTVDNTAVLPTTWTAVLTPTVDPTTGQIIVLAQALPYADVDSYGFNISQIPDDPENTYLGASAQYNRDEDGLPIGHPFVRQTVDNVRPNETYYVSFIAMDEQSGWTVQSQEIAVTVSSGDYQLSTAQGSYQVEPGATISFSVSLNILQPLFYPDVYLELEGQELPRGLSVLFEGDALGITNLNSENPSANLIVTADETVPEGFYSLNLLGLNGENNKTLPLTIQVGHPSIYLPVVGLNTDFRDHPDLVVQSLTVIGQNATVVIANEGSGPVVDAFWVDLYINPNPLPIMVNQTWSQLGNEGVVWGVTVSLSPGQSITLTIGDVYYHPELSNFSGTIPAGTPVYAQVDSVDTTTTYGAILEEHEVNGGVYNNIAGPVAPSVTVEVEGTAVSPTLPNIALLPRR